MHATHATPIDERAHARRWWTLLVLCLSLALIGLDNTILNVALPTLGRDLEASTSQLQWIVDSYVLVFAGLLLCVGSLGDRFGRKRVLQLGLVVFLVGSVLSSCAGSADALIATRALMGLGAAAIMPSTLSILTNLFTDAAERAKAIAVWAGVSAMGIAIGPTTGGWLLEHFSWHSVFIVNVPVVVGALALGRWLVPESRDPRAPRLDPVGAILSVAGLVALVFAVIEAPEAGWTSVQTLGVGVGALAILAAFVAWELRREQPMLEIRFFRDPRFSAASLTIMLVFFALFGALFFLTQLLQFVMGFTALEAGVRTIPSAVAVMAAAPLSAPLVQRLGTKLVVAAGLTLVAAAMFSLATFDVGDGYGPVLAAMVVLGLGMGLVMAPATESVMGSLPLEQAGVGSATNDTTRELGGALGVAILGSLLSSRYSSAVDEALAGSALPPDAATAVRDGVGGAAIVADRVGGDAGQALLEVARSAFVDGMGLAFLVAGAVALAGAVVALVFLPARPGTLAELDDELVDEPVAA
jgi:EmrB/QacA subfamily drug resistance transporter